MTADSSQDPLDEWSTRRYHLLWGIGVSYSYHRKRQRFFDQLDKLTKAATVLAGATLAGTAVRDYLPWVGAGISSLGMLSLVFGYGDRRQTHKDLAESYMQLKAKIEEVTDAEVTEVLMRKLEADLTRLNVKEPPTLYVLVTLCENEQSIAMGAPERVRHVSWFKRTCADWFSFRAPSPPPTPSPSTD